MKACDPSYQLRAVQPAVEAPKGPLTLFELVPQTAGAPRFIGRWDDNDESIDVDAAGISKSEWTVPKLAKMQGNAGHHTLPVGGRTELTFDCELKLGGSDILRATIELAGLYIDKHATIALKEPPKVSANAKVVIHVKARL